MQIRFTRRSLIVGLLALAGMVLQPTLAEAQKKGKGEKPAKNPQVEMQIDMRNPKKTVKIIIELYSKEAPKTVQHFLELANKKFYDGILFHRYIPNFVLQGGDPASKKVDGGLIADMPSQEVGEKYGLGVGGSGKNVPLEAKISHTRGTLGLARSQAPDSGDSQFFFNLVDNLSLDTKYCVFGKVIKGIENVDKMRQGDKIRSVRPIKK